MSENTGGQAANNNEEFELLSTAPSSPDISGQLKPARGGGGLPKVTLGLIGAVLLAGGFVGGIAVGKHNSSSTSSSTATPGSGQRSRGGFGGGNGGANGGANGGGFGGGRGGVSGTVTAVNGSTITVTDSTGKSVTVDTSPQTTVTIGKTGAVSDLTAGQQVTVIGTTDSGGTVTARSVVSGFTGLGFGRGGGNRTPSGAPSSSGASNG
jgi:ABC-type Fe3+-hydroxamate transport system substrate-binding protein